MINSIILFKIEENREIIKSNLYNVKIPFLNETLLDGANGDILLIPFIELYENEFMTHKIYVRADNSLRLIIGYIKINE